MTPWPKTLKRQLNVVKIRKGLDEKGMTKNEAYPLWIWRVIRKDFIAKTLRRFAMGNCRFKVKTKGDGIPLQSLPIC